MTEVLKITLESIVIVGSNLIMSNRTKTGAHNWVLYPNVLSWSGKELVCDDAGKIIIRPHHQKV